MPRRGPLARRPAAEWGARTLLAFTAAVIGYASVVHSLGAVLKNNPERANAVSPRDGQVAARLSQNLITADMGRNLVRSERLARFALEREPTAVAAIATLGFVATKRGDLALARRWFAYSEHMSRRDLQSQLWAIEDAVARNDIPQALRHYDTALRTSRSAPDLLFPVLATASTDPIIGKALIGVLARKPSWGGAFVDYTAGHASDTRATAALFGGIERAGAPVSDGAKAALITALISGGYWDDAWRYYASVRPGADPRVSRDLRYTGDVGIPFPFEWTPSNDASVTASIQRGIKGSLFDFATSPGLGGMLIQQLQTLPPGDYRLEGHSIGIDQPEGSRPYWVLTCQEGRELGRVNLPNSAQANGAFSGRFSVPPGCQAQTLALIARPSDSVSGSSGQIDRVQLRPIR